MPNGQNPQLQPSGPQQVNHQVSQNAQHANSAATQGNPQLAVSQLGMRGGIPQAQMQPNMRSGANGTTHGTPDNMQQRVLEAQRLKMNGAQYQMAPPNRVSPGGIHPLNGVMSNQSNQPLINGMPNPPSRTPGQQAQTGNIVASPHMPPPPTPTGQPQQPQQLSSGHIPAISHISHQIQSQNPQASPDKIKEMTNDHFRQLYAQQQQSHQHARQSALSAAAGPHAINPTPNSSPAYNQNHAAFHQNNGNTPHATFNNNGNNNSGTPGGGASSQQYSTLMRQRLLAQQSQMQQPNPGTPGQINGSPRVPQASPAPVMTAPSPNMTPVPTQQSMPPHANNRTPTPQLTRVGSSQGASAASATSQPPTQQQTPSTMQHQSPRMQQASPRPVSAGIARP